MPSKNSKQHKLMVIAAHTSGGYGGVPQSVGKDFEAADKAEGKKFSMKKKHMASGGLTHKKSSVHTGRIGGLGGMPMAPPPMMAPPAAMAPRPPMGGAPAPGMSHGGKVKGELHHTDEHDTSHVMKHDGKKKSRDGIAERGKTRAAFGKE